MNTAAIVPVKFEIQRYTLKSGAMRWVIAATLSDGRVTVWGDPRTERGAATVLARAARRHGFKVTGDTAQRA